ncbi:sensor histidine kinase, partial [Enterococcus faecalis]|nr:sensor histidine kinase [Enterococcus faecalis]
YVARLDSFSKDYLVQEISLKAVIQPVLRSQANYFIQKNLHYAVEGEDQQVLTDEKWLGVIFRQLVSNAVKYTPQNGQLTIRIEKDAQGTYRHLQDSGIGIPKEDMRRIFDKGFT